MGDQAENVGPPIVAVSHNALRVDVPLHNNMVGPGSATAISENACLVRSSSIS